MFDASDPTLTLQLIAEYTTPGAAVSVEIYNGLAYVADSSAGMHILNYRPSDVAGVPPLVSFTTNAPGGQIGEGELIIVDVEASDDEQLRNVELLVDGQVTQTDGNFPFQFDLNAPRLSEASSVALEMRASDTGGNRALSGTQTITILADNTPPVVTGTFPLEDFIAFDAEAVELRFSENIDPVQLNPGGFELLDLGADAVAGGGDDLAVGLADPTMPDSDSVLLTPSAPRAPGVYQLTVNSAGIVDLAGNPMASPFVLRFGVQQAPVPNVARWARLSSGQWSDPRNWSSGLPTDNDVVVIDNIGDAITVTLTDASIITVAGVQCFEDFVLSGGWLEVEGEAFFDRGLKVISDSKLVISGAAASLTLGGPIEPADSEIRVEDSATATIEDLIAGAGTTLYVSSGGELHLPNTTAFNDGAIIRYGEGVFDAPLLTDIDNTRIEIRGGAQLNLPLITSYTIDLNQLSVFLVVGAESLLDLPALASIDMSAAGHIFISADDSGTLNLPSVTSFTMPTSQLGLTADVGGTLTMPLISSVERTVLTLIGAGSTLNLNGIESMMGGRVKIQEGQFALPNLDSISGASVLMSDAGEFNAPALTTLNDVYVDLEDGSIFNASALTSAAEVDIFLRTGTAFTLHNITALPDSRIEIEPGSQFSALALTSLTMGDVVLSGSGVLTVPLLEVIDGTRLQLSGGATLTLPLVVQYQSVANQVGTIFGVEDAGSALSLPALSILDRSSSTNVTFDIESSAGASLDLSALTTLVSSSGDITRFTADGAGSTIDLNALTTFDAALVEFVETNGGVITRP